MVAAGLDGDPLWLATVFVPGPPLSSAVTAQGPFPEASMWRLAAGLYAAGADGDVYALRAADGHELWRYATGGSLQSSVAVAGTMVYAGTINGILYALRAPG